MRTEQLVLQVETHGYDEAKRQSDGLAKSQDGLAKSTDTASAAGDRSTKRTLTMAEAQAKFARQNELNMRAQERMNAAYGQSLSDMAAKEVRAASDRSNALASVGNAFKQSAKFAVEHPIIVAAGAAVSTRALGGLAASAGTSLAAASAATARFANDNTAMGGKVATAAGVASRGLGAASGAATAAAGGLVSFADRASRLTSVTAGLSRALGLVSPLLGPIALGFLALKVASDVMDKARSDLDRLIETGKRAEALDVGAPFLNSFTGLGEKVRLETSQVEAAIKQASGFVEEQFGGDRLAKLVADITAATGGAALKAAQRIDLAQGTEERIRAALAAMVELEERGQRLAAIDLGEKVFGAAFVQNIRRGETTFAKMADELRGLDAREMIRKEDVAAALALSREIEAVKAEIRKAVSVTFDFSAAAQAVDGAWLEVLKKVRDVAVTIDNTIKPGPEGAYIRRLQALASEIETVSIPREIDRGNLAVVESLRERLAGLREEIDRLSPSLRNAGEEIDRAVGRVPPALPIMSDELTRLRAAAEAAASGLDSTGASAAAAGAQLAGAAAKAQGFAAALNAIQAANPNLASTISLMGQMGDIQKKVAEGSKAVFDAFDEGKIGDPEAQQLLKKLNTDAAESMKALREQAEKPWKSYAREAEIGTLRDLDQGLARAGDRYNEVRAQAENYYRVQIDRATPEARGALEKERAEALARVDEAFKRIETTTRDNAAERGAKDAAKAAKDAAKDFETFKGKAEDAFEQLFPQEALKKKGEELQKELAKFRDELAKIDPRLVTSMEAKISLNLDGKDIETVKDKSGDLAKEMSSTFRGVFDDMFTNGQKGLTGMLDNITKGFARIGSRLMEKSLIEPLFSGKGDSSGIFGGKGGFLGIDLSDLRKTFKDGFGEGFDNTFGPLMEPAKNAAGESMGFMSSTMGKGLASAGIGASIGYSSGSPLTGMVGGGIAGLMTGNPIMGVVGAGAGLIGGSFGRKPATKERMHEYRQRLRKLAARGHADGHEPVPA